MAEAREAAPVALKERREQIVQALCDHVARDALTLEEFERRVDAAHRARTSADLERLVADLPAQEPPPVPDSAVRPATTARRGERDHQVVLAVLGGQTRKGGWAPTRRNSIIAVMGGIELDFREAHLPPGVTEVNVTAIWGGVDIIVPPGLTVECGGTAILGGFDHVDRGMAADGSDSRILRIGGLALMGGVSIRVRHPGESERDARRRRREERRSLRRQQQRLRGG